MEPLPCRCGCAHAGHRRRGNATQLRGACLTPGCGCPDYFGDLPMPVQVDRFPVTIRKDPTVVREYGDRAPLAQSPFAQLRDQLAEAGVERANDLAMMVADRKIVAPSDARGEVASLRQWERDEVERNMARMGLPVQLDTAAAIDEVRCQACGHLRPWPHCGTCWPKPEPEDHRPQPVEDWRVWYCHACRFAGQPDGHVDCEHVIVPGRLKLYLDV